MTITKKGCARGLATVTVALLILIALLIGVAFGGDKVLDIIIGGQLERQAAINEHERQERIRDAETSTEIEKEETLRGMEIAVSGAWLVFKGGLALVALGASCALVVAVWRLALGWTRSMREGAAIGYAWASRQPVPQSLTYSPRHQATIKDVTTDQLAQLPAPVTSDDLAAQITATLAALGLSATAKEVATGPQVITFAVTPRSNEKGKLTTVKEILNRAADFAVALGVKNVRIAPAPGYIALEVPRSDRELVPLTDLLASKVWQNAKALLPLALGKDTQGQWVVADLVKLPHILVGGATNGGKSVAVNSMLVGLMNKYTPGELKLLLIDPKQVELIPYSNSPYLAQPVVTDATKALPVLEGAIVEMEARYTLLAEACKKNIVSYNKVAKIKLPWFVIVIDEFADLIMVAEEVQDVIVRLAQKARAVGMHIVLATQRPSKEVVTGLIKANLPGRMSLAVPDGVNSKIILDEMGAEQLLGMGDGLFKSQSISTVRVQAPFISDDELAEFLALKAAPNKPTERALMTLTPSSTKNAQKRLPPAKEAYLGEMTGGNNEQITAQLPQDNAQIMPQSSDNERGTRQNDDSDSSSVTVIEQMTLPSGAKGRAYQAFMIAEEAGTEIDYGVIAQFVGTKRNNIKSYYHEFKSWKKSRQEEKHEPAQTQ